MSTETTNKKIKIDNGTTFGRAYTDKAIDAKLPTDLIASANKLSLGVGNTALGNGVNLSGFTYDEATKTLKAKGGDDSAIKTITLSNTYGMANNYINITDDESNFIKTNFPVNIIVKFSNGIKILLTPAYFSMVGGEPSFRFIINDGTSNAHDKITQVKICYISYYNYPKRIFISNTENIQLDDSLEKKYTNTTTGGFDEWGTSNVYKLKVTNPLPNVPTTETKSYYLDGTYDASSGTSAIKWKVLKKTYNHYIVISDGSASNAIYLLITSTNNLICNILPNLDTLLGTEHRFIQASGVITDNASKLPIVAINWQGSFSSSKIVTMSSEEATAKFTDISDIVEPA